MIYFYKVLLDETDTDLIEKGIRSHSIEKYYNLDILKSTVLVESKDRFFWGLEKKKSMKLLRIRSVIEFFLPKLIIKFDKNDFTKYSLRFSTLSLIIVIAMLIGFITAIFDTISNTPNFEPIVTSFIFIISFYFLTRFEMRIINKKVNRAIQNKK